MPRFDITLPTLERWLTKENVVVIYVTFVELYSCAVGGINIVNT
jgi:hypothetical protein